MDCISSTDPGFEIEAFLSLAPLFLTFLLAWFSQYFENRMAGIVFCKQLVYGNKYVHLCYTHNIQQCVEMGF